MNPCTPDHTNLDSCLGDDQLILGAITSEEKCWETFNDELYEGYHKTWTVIVESFFCGKKAEDCHKILSSRFESLLSGGEVSSIFNGKPFLKDSITYEQSDHPIESPECQAELLLMKKATKYMLVNWKHDTFPKSLPSD